jgi:hypothetical protein
MRFARFVHGITAAYGLVSLAPLYFMIERIEVCLPPAGGHPLFTWQSDYYRYPVAFAGGSDFGNDVHRRLYTYGQL